MSTLAGEFGEKLALAASNSGLPGAGIAHRSYSASDSCGGIALPRSTQGSHEQACSQRPWDEDDRGTG